MDDKILEVVAVFGSAQLGLSRVVNLQHHRIAQVNAQASLKVFGVFIPKEALMVGEASPIRVLV